MNYARLSSAAIAATALATIMATSALAADAARGKETYDRVGCWSCHGYDGQGGAGTGPKLAPDPLPVDAIRAFIRAPQTMPPYREAILSDAEVADIHAYLESIPAAPNVADTILSE